MTWNKQLICHRLVSGEPILKRVRIAPSDLLVFFFTVFLYRPTMFWVKGLWSGYINLFKCRHTNKMAALSQVTENSDRGTWTHPHHFTRRNDTTDSRCCETRVDGSERSGHVLERTLIQRHTSAVDVGKHSSVYVHVGCSSGTERHWRVDGRRRKAECRVLIKHEWLCVGGWHTSRCL